MPRLVMTIVRLPRHPKNANIHLLSSTCADLSFPNHMVGRQISWAMLLICLVDDICFRTSIHISWPEVSSCVSSWHHWTISFARRSGMCRPQSRLQAFSSLQIDAWCAGGPLLSPARPLPPARQQRRLMEFWRSTEQKVLQLWWLKKEYIVYCSFACLVVLATTETSFYKIHFYCKITKRLP